MTGITWQKAALMLTIMLTSVGTLTYTDLFGVLFQLKGMDYNFTGDIHCGSECNISINTTTSYWRYEFANYSGTKYEDKTLFKKQSRSRTLHINTDNIDKIITTKKLLANGSWMPYDVPVDWNVPTYGHRWRSIKDGDSWERKKVNKIQLNFHKNPEDTIKWSFGINDYIDIDPILFPPYNITDNIVSIDDDNIILETYPHTLSESGYVTFNLTSKQFNGDIDIVWGFNSTGAMPKSAGLYKPHDMTEIKTYTCDSPYRYNYTTTPKHFWCWYDYNETIIDNETNKSNNISKTSLLFNHDFDSAYPQNKSVAWSETHIEDYVDIHDKVNKVQFDYDGMDTWYYSKNIGVTDMIEYSVKAWVDVPFNSGYNKYLFCVKPSSMTIQQAQSNGYFYCLDPWWNSAWTYYRPIDVNVSENVTDYQILINITNKTNAQSDCSDMRFTDKYNLTEWDYWIQECNPTYALVWVEGNFTTSNGTQIGYWYGNETAVTSQSNITDTMISGDECDSLDYWTTTGGAPSISGGECVIQNSSVAEGIYLNVNVGTDTILDTKYKTVGTSTSVSSVGYGDGTAADMDSISDGAYTFKYNAARYYINRKSGGGSTQSGGGAEDDSQHTFTIKRISTTKVEYIRDGTSLYNHTVAANIPTINLKAQVGQRAHATTTTYVDYVFTRKYIYPNPTYSIGAEQTEITEIYIDSCTDLNQAGKTYKMNASISDSSTSYCMNISANNITLDCEGYTIDGNDAADYGIYASRASPETTNITIKNCTITDWDTYGIYLYYANENNLTDLTVSSNPDQGIGMLFSSLNTLTNIIVNSSIIGIYTVLVDGCTFSNLTIYLSSSWGLFIDGSEHEISGSTFYSQSGTDDVGLYIDDDDNMIYNNTIHSNYYGIQLDTTATNNTIYNNTIYNNTYGIYMDGAGSGEVNIIYNNLFNQTNNVKFEAIFGNDWNTTNQTGTRIYSDGTNIGGNYWTNSTATGYSDTCTDSDTDGFCDTVLNITNMVTCTVGVDCGDNVDYLPLSDKYSDVEDTCTYSGSGNWAIVCNDNCSLVSTDLLGNNFSIIGDSATPTTGLSNLYNYVLGHISGGCTVAD